MDIPNVSLPLYSKLKIMKKVFLMLPLVFSLLLGFSQQNQLIKKTIDSKLTVNDFINDSGYFINDGEFKTYTNKLEYVKIVNSLMEGFKNMDVIYKKELDDNFLYYPTKKHVFFVVSSGEDRCLIDLWFGEKDYNKLQGLTFFKYKKES